MPPSRRPERTPPPALTVLLTDQLQAWAAVEAAGVPLRRVLDIWLQDCHAKGYAFPNWEGEAKTQLKKAYYEARERPMPRAPRGITAAEWDALVARKIAEEAAARAADPEAVEWADPKAVYSLHYPCGVHHQRYGACPARPAATPPAATDTGPPPESSGFHRRQVVQAAQTDGLTGLGVLMPARVASNGHGHRPHPEPEGAAP